MTLSNPITIARRLVIALTLMLSSMTTLAMTAPDQLTRETADKLLAEVKARQAEFRNDPSKLYSSVDTIVVPHFDFELMSRLVLARYWKKANPTQQEKFSAAFRSLLVRTYANALLEYSDEKLDWKPLRMGSGDDRVKVHSEIIRSSGPSIPMVYSLRLKDDGWKVYDVAIESISLVTNYRGSFAAQIKKDGLDKLIADLEKKAAGTAE